MCVYEFIFWRCPVCTGPTVDLDTYPNPRFDLQTGTWEGLNDWDSWCRFADCHVESCPSTNHSGVMPPFAVVRYNLECGDCLLMRRPDFRAAVGFRACLRHKIQASRYVPDILTSVGRIRRKYWAREKIWDKELREWNVQLGLVEAGLVEAAPQKVSRLEKFMAWF
jgi:hypothetical protein